MTNLRLMLLATSALTLAPLMTTPSHAQSAPVTLAQAAPSAETGPDGKPKAPPKGPPPKAAPPAHTAPPPAATQRPVAPPPHAEPPRAPPPPAAVRPATPPPPHVTPPTAAQPRPATPPPHITPPTPPAAPKAAPAPQPTTPPAAPKPPSPPAAAKPAPTAPAPVGQPKAAPSTMPPTSVEPEATRREEGGRRVGEPGRDRRGPGTPGGRPNGTPPAQTTPPAPGAPTAAPTNAPPPAAAPNGAGAPTATPPVGPNGTKAAPQAPPGGQTALPPGAPVSRHGPPTVTAPLPPPPPVSAQALKPIAPGAAPQGPRNIEAFRSERRETDQGGRKVFTEPGRVIVVDPSGQSFIRHNEEDRFRYGARDIRQERVGNDTRTIVVRPDGTQIITVSDRDGRLLRRIRRDQRGREIILIDNNYRGVGAAVAAGVVAGAIGGYFVSLPPPVITIPPDRYIVEAEGAPPDLIYDTLIAPPVERIDRRYTLDEIRYSPAVRERMRSIDLDSINFATGSWDIPPDQAAKLQVIADGLNRAIARNPQAVFLIEGHTDAVGSDVDNLSLSDRRAQSAAELLTQQFNVPPENLTSQGYGEQYLKVQTDGPSRENRRVTIRNITPLLNGGTSLPPPPPGTAPPRR
ncbi:MAG: OmpA family protein [Proteobacteria bacterium]|nr:OmpA family protein [Pseudomonadota bacterium]